MIDQQERLPAFEERLLGELRTLVREGGSNADEASIASGRRRRRSRFALVAVAATLAVALALALPVVIPWGGPGGADPAAAAVLHHLSRVARRADAVAAPTSGEFVYTRSRYSETTLVGSDAPGGDYRYVDTVERQIWIGPDGSGRLVEVAGDTSFPTPADASAWRADGSPDLGGGSGTDETYQAGGLFFQDLSGFSSQPDQLRSELQAFADRRNESTFDAAGELLRETYASGDLRSALFDVVANLPDVQALGDVKDAAGRPGVGVAFTSGDRTSELIFDPKTSALLGESSVVGSAPDLRSGIAVGTDWATAYLESSIVSSIGPDSIPGAGPRSYCTTTAEYTSHCND